MAGTKPNVGTIDIFWQRGAIVGERYRLLDRIDRGGCGEVHCAEPLNQPGSIVAIKRLLHGTESIQMRKRFQREMEILSHLRPHENVVSLLGSGQHRGQDYLVMEYVRGQTLRDWLQLRKQEPHPSKPLLGFMLSLIQQVCNALHAAHRLGIIHRDLKPSNIMLVSDSYREGSVLVKVVDFGIGRIGERSDTRTDDRLGTDGYMSPEQASGGWRDVGAATDVFSIGVLCMEILTLNGVSEDGSPYANFVVQGWNRLPRYLRKQRPDLPVPLLDVITHALRPRYKERYPNAGELWRAIEAALSPHREPMLQA